MKCNGSSTNLRRGFAAEHPAPPAGPQRRRSGAETVRMSSPITPPGRAGTPSTARTTTPSGTEGIGPGQALNVIPQRHGDPEPCVPGTM